MGALFKSIYRTFSEIHETFGSFGARTLRLEADRTVPWWILYQSHFRGEQEVATAHGFEP